MNIRAFGEAEGVPIVEITIASKAGAVAKILNWGAVVRDLIVPSKNGPQRVTLGLNSLADYEAHSPSFGAVPGRFANRIANGRFSLDGVDYELDRKPGEKHTLHGGPHGFGKRPWRLANHDETSVTLTLHSADGDSGFPGALEATCVYRIEEPSTLRVELTAVSDRPTIVNLTQHAYFNLDGSADILDHELTLNADFYTPTDADLIPTGEIRAVAGTPYDFRSARPVRHASGQTYDTNFVLAARILADGLAPAARLRSPKNGLTLDLFTTEPGVQFYDAAKLNCPVPGLDGAHYGPHAGLCLEPQVYPDSPNRRHFPDCVLRPDEEYRHVSAFRFSY
ncbi:MAG TPA: aldose epimerase family protein [Roseiarcus sp.]|nr:aldose epimerase family protein [Roseiarcus sp.]